MAVIAVDDHIRYFYPVGCRIIMGDWGVDIEVWTS